MGTAWEAGTVMMDIPGLGKHSVGSCMRMSLLPESLSVHGQPYPRERPLLRHRTQHGSARHLMIQQAYPAPRRLRILLKMHLMCKGPFTTQVVVLLHLACSDHGNFLRR